MSTAASHRRASISGLAPVVLIPLLDHKVEGELPDIAILSSILEKTEASKLAQTNAAHALIAINASSTIATAVQILAQHRILSAPVMTDDGQSCLGCVDLLSIVDYAVNHVIVAHKTDKTDPSSKDNIGNLSSSAILHDMNKSHHEIAAPPTLDHNLALTPQEVAQSPISLLLSASLSQSNTTRVQLIPFFEHNSVDLLLELFANRVHRVALITDSNELSTIVSQSDLIHYLDHHIFQAGKCLGLKEVKIGNLPLNARELATVNPNISVRLAISAMISKDVSSLAIIDSTSGKFLGDFSSSALRSLTDFRMMNMKLIEFLQMHHPISLTPQRVNRSATLFDIVSKMSTHRCHRVWLLNDESQKPLDLFTMTDICRLLSSHQRVTSLQASSGANIKECWVPVSRAVIQEQETKEGVFAFHIV